MKEKRVNSALIIVAVITVAAVSFGVWYFLAGPGADKETKFEATISPNTLHVGDNYTIELHVTNRESGTMIITGISYSAYLNNQLLYSDAIPVGDLTATSIPPGQTVTVFSVSDTESSVGTWRVELFLNTNYGPLTTSFTFTVLEEEIFENRKLEAEVLRSFDSPCNSPEGLAWDGSYLWCGDWDSHRIYKINPETGKVVASFDFPGGREAGPGGLAWDGDYLWCGDRPANIIYKINPHTGAVIRTIDFPGYGGPAGLAWDGSYLWCGDANGNWIYKIDPMTGELIKSFQLMSLSSYTKGLAWDGIYLWCCEVEDGAKNKIYKIDPDSGEVINYLYSPTPPTLGIKPAGLAWNGDSLWYVEKNREEGGGKIYKLAITP